jgi:hypothetical protein
LRYHSPAVQVEGHGQLQGIQRAERMFHRVGSHQRFCTLKVTPGHYNDFELAPSQIGIEPPSKLFERCLVDHPHPDLGGENGFDLNQRKLRDDQPGLGCFYERFHALTSDFPMVEFRQCAGLKEIARHLTFVPLCREVGF